jgi:hypothetical protein
MSVDVVHAESASAFTCKIPNDVGGNWARSGRPSDPVVDRAGADVEPLREAFYTVALDELGKLRSPISPDSSVHRPTLYFYGTLFNGFETSRSEHGDLRSPNS